MLYIEYNRRKRVGERDSVGTGVRDDGELRAREKRRRREVRGEVEVEEQVRLKSRCRMRGENLPIPRARGTPGQSSALGGGLELTWRAVLLRQHQRPLLSRIFVAAVACDERRRVGGGDWRRRRYTRATARAAHDHGISNRGGTHFSLGSDRWLVSSRYDP